MNVLGRLLAAAIPFLLGTGLATAPTSAQEKKPNIILIMGDDHGYGDIGVHGGGEGRGMPTSSPDRLANEGPITISQYERLKNVRERLKDQDFELPMPSGN